MNSIIDETTLREVYLLPFEIAIAASNPWSLMAAYNDVNGQAATEQVHVNNEIVKGEWGYDGVLMSDWFATKTAGPAANGGLDLVMPGPDGPWGDALLAAVASCEVSEAVIDDHLVRLLRLADRVGSLGEVRPMPTGLPTPDSAIRREQLTRIAASGMTVLTNDGVLPLSRDRSVALIGRHAIDTVDMGGGSAQVNPPHQVSVAEGVQEVLGDRVTVVDGVQVRNRPSAASGANVFDPVSGEQGVQIEVYGADDTLLRSWTAPVAHVMVGFDDDYSEPVRAARFRTRTPLRGPVEVGGVGTGDWSVTLGDQVERFELTAPQGIGAVMLAPSSQVRAMRATDDADLVEAFIRLPASTGSPMADVGLFDLVLRPVAPPAEDAIRQAADAAKDADVAVVVVGLTEEQETEAADKSTIALVGHQDALVSAVAAEAKKTVVVVNAATPVLMPWIDEVDAVLWAGLPGQEGGHAVCAALFGDIEPAGRLVTTFPSADGAAPAWEVVPTDGALTYSEGTAIGYRGYYAGIAAAPAFWLGHGPGYATWEYSNAELVDDGVQVRVHKIGDRPSREVVQVYYEPSELGQPVRLVGWSAQVVPAAESATVQVCTDARMFRRWDTSAGAWGTPLSGGRLMVARGLGDIRAQLQLP